MLMLFTLLVAAGNFALGFVLAVHMGHGPHWIDLSSPGKLMHSLRAALRGRKQVAGHHD